MELQQSIFQFHFTKYQIDLLGSNNLAYTATNVNGNCSNSKNFNVIGHQTPDVSIIDQGIICSNQGIVDYNSTNSNVLNSIAWSGVGISDGINGFLDPNSFSDSTIIYASFDSICQSQDSLVILLDNPPDATIISNDTIYCYGQIITTPLVVNSGGIWSGNSVDPSSVHGDGCSLHGIQRQHPSCSPRPQPQTSGMQGCGNRCFLVGDRRPLQPGLGPQKYPPSSLSSHVFYWGQPRLKSAQNHLQLLQEQRVRFHSRLLIEHVFAIVRFTFTVRVLYLVPHVGKLTDVLDLSVTT